MITVICMMLLLWSVVSYLELQRSMRWWFERRTAHLEAQSERLHNGVMQELFVLRRELEATLHQGHLLPSHSNPASSIQLQAIEKIHHQLEQISDELSPPYIADSLPLAVQAYGQEWQHNHPETVLELELPKIWEQQATPQDQILLMGLDELLQMVMPGSQTTLPCRVRLTTQDQPANNGAAPTSWGELSVEVTYPNAVLISSVLRTRELRYLRRVVRGLTHGRLLNERRGLTVTWYFRWVLRSTPSLTVGLD
ncbi:hypothetical protein [Egbenema bharatensis]|uniref:hypothetical protein n=1 Tax=Egbenema bharatensis TaxID=3463334 RepID=UPI003A866AD2